MAQEALVKVLESAWQLVREIEPARGKVTDAQVTAARAALDQVAIERARHDLSRVDPDEARRLKLAIAAVHARAAALAIAAGDEANAERWLAIAEPASPDDDQRAEIATARRAQDRYRALVHGRYLIAHGHESAARTIWKPLARPPVATDGDAISRAATGELQAPRPLGPNDSVPTLYRFNGIGVGFYGSRDRWPDGSYATTHCVSALWIPIFPLTAWRVRDEGTGYRVLAREQLSRFARLSRWVMLGGLALAIAGYATVAHFTDPERLARQRWDAALAFAATGGAEPALQRLDAELASDLASVDEPRAQRAGAEIVRLTASYVAAPLTTDKVDQAVRVVRRYQALPRRAQYGAAERALFTLVDGWIRQIGTRDTVAVAEARLALASAASEVAPPPWKAALEADMAAIRLALAAAKQADEPLDALAILVGPTGKLDGSVAIDAAGKIVARLDEAPSMLLDGGTDLDAWMSATTDGDLRTRTAKLRDLAGSGRTAADAEGVTPAQLVEMQAQRPWDQFVAIQLAQSDAGAGKLDAAAARLARIGPPGMTVRQARFLRAQIAAGQGKLDDADAQIAALLGPRVQRFAAASAALRDTAKTVQARIDGALRTGAVPDDLKRRYQTATEPERDEMVSHWIDEQMKADAELTTARANYVALGDVVPMALAAGSIKLRRAQVMSGTARDHLLQDAERAFLAIRTEAEGEPSFRLGLGEIYARLGKTAESEAELTAVLAKHDPALDLQVAGVYRNLGSVARAKQVASALFARASSPAREAAAQILAVMSEDAESEDWYRKADQRNPAVIAALLEREGNRLEREGKTAECAAKFSAAAKVQLAQPASTEPTRSNNAALAYERGFDCSGDPQALRDAEATLEIAYRNAPEDPLVIGNLTYLLRANGQLRVLAGHIGVRALRLQLADAATVIDELVDGSERGALLAELAADPSIRRSAALLAQLEVLMPNRTLPYTLEFTTAARRRDLAGATAVVERLRGAKALDVSEGVAERQRWRTGADDEKWLASPANSQARLEAVLAAPGGDRLDARTRAVGWFLIARADAVLGLYRADKAVLRHAREAATTAMQLWPALDGDSLVVTALIDEAGLASDARAWIASRRGRSATAALGQLVAAHDPLAAQIRAAPPWADVAGHSKLHAAYPGLGDLRLARLLGDPALEAAARPVLDDKLVRLGLELVSLTSPDDSAAKEDLAYLDAR